MSRPDPAAIKHVQEKITEIQRALSAMQYLCSGTLSKRMKLCGKPQCQCGVNPAARHGPYYEWTYRKAGRLEHRTLSPAHGVLMRLAIANYRKAKKLLRAWEAHTQRLIDLNAPE
jgi:hypothetical protein